MTLKMELKWLWFGIKNGAIWAWDYLKRECGYFWYDTKAIWSGIRDSFGVLPLLFVFLVIILPIHLIGFVRGGSYCCMPRR